MNEREDAELFDLFPAGHAVDLTKNPPKKKPKNVPMDASFAPVPDPPTQMTRLKTCALSVCPYVLFSGLSFVWWQKGLMAESVAMPTCAVMLVIIGFSVGRFLFPKK